MTQHLHIKFVEGCYRCDLSRDEVTPRFKEPKVKSSAALKRAQREAEERSRGWCEVAVPEICKPGRHRADHFHHIVIRSQGGEDTAANLLHLCLAAHEWAHRNRTESERLGIIRRRTA